jgi:hypothetical protein
VAVPLVKGTRIAPVRRRRAGAVVLAVALAAAGWFAVGGGTRKISTNETNSLLPGGVTVSPSPGAHRASPETEISFLGATRAKLGAVEVTGSRSGRHAGRLVSYASRKGTSFVPATQFAPGERVTVTATGIGARYSFTVSRPAALTGSELPIPTRAPLTEGAFSFSSAPALHPAQVTVQGTQRSGGYAFVSPVGLSGAASHGQAGPLILDAAGNPVWQGTLPAGVAAMNFRPQTYGGRPVLTWWQGQTSPLGYGIGVDEIVDSSYRTIATVQAGNGYSADMHEFRLTRRGSAFVTAYRPVYADLRPYGGDKNGQVLNSVVQQIDVKTGRVMFEWDALDHISMRESYAEPTPGTPWDAVHINAVDIGPNHQLLLTARNTWGVYDVDARSGQVSWRLGGKRSSFRLGKSDRFAYEHDARFQPNNQISLFDDEDTPQVGSESRGLLLKLDTGDHTARTVASYTHPSKLLASSQGNLQMLPDGNVLIGWGAAPYYSVFTHGGKLLYDVRLPGPDESYRTILAPWKGAPASPPQVAAHREADGTTSLYASWNGATRVASWRVLTGKTKSLLVAVGAPVPRTGFETAVATRGGGPYFAVEALDSSGRLLATSAAVRP